MASLPCAYCAAECPNPIPLDWALNATEEDPPICVRLNLCERCASSWAGTSSDGFVPALLPEKKRKVS